MTKIEARRAVRAAIKSGVLVRPDTCEKCGQIPARRVDGYSQIQAHHPDYDKPLDVEWLCCKCHRKETPLPEVMGAPVFGERNGQAKLTHERVTEIRSSPLGCRRLAKKIGVHKATIQRVRNGVHWSAAAPTPSKQSKEGEA